MKIKSLLAVAFLALASQSHAFTLDFASLFGVSLPPDVVANIGGYGSVRLSAGTDAFSNTTPLEVWNTFGAPAIEFQEGDVFFVDFLDGAAFNFSIAQIDQGVGENFVISANADQTRYRIALSGPGAAAGIQSITFDSNGAVPEPTAVSLGLVGLAGFALRRRRSK